MAKYKIMIVEDEEIVAADIQKTLEQMGYSVCEMASSGMDAITKAGSTRPDLVLMDIVLKGSMDGIEAATQIKKLFEIPVVYLTAFGEDSILQKAKVAEPYGYITKPFRYRELQIAIEISIYKKQAETKIKRMENWLATVLKSIGDAVIASDKDRRITFMNAVAEKLTGWNQEDALGKKLTDVLNIKDQDLSDLEKHLVEKVITEGLIINLIEDRLLITKDGKHIPISDSAAPIKDDNDETPGSVIIFRDISEHKQAEKALRESDERLRFAMETSQIGLWNLDILDHSAFRSLEHDRIFGYEELLSDWTYEMFLEHVMPEDRLMVDRKFQHSIENKSNWNFECRIRRTDGEVRWILAAGRHQGKAADGGQRIAGIVQDITERKQVEEEIQRNQSRLRRLVDILQHPSETIQEFLDYSLDQIIHLTGSKIGYIYHYHEDRKMFVLNTWSKEVMVECTVANPSKCYELDNTGIWGEAVRQRRPIIINDFKAAHPLKKGYPEGHVQLSKFMTVPIFRGDSVVGVVGLANKETDYEENDILQTSLLMEAVWKVTESKRAEEAQRESEERYRNIFENASEGIFQSTVQGRYITVNPAFARMSGYDSPEEMIRDVTDIAGQLYVHPEDPQEINRLLMNAGAVTGYEAEFRRKDSRHIWVSINIKTVRDSAGNIICHEGTAEEITKRKLAEQKLQEQLRFLQTLMDAIPSPIFYKDTKGIYLGCNRTFAEFNGLTKEEIIGKSVYDLWTKELADNYYQADEYLLKNPGVQIYESSLMHASGDLYPVIFYKATFNNQDGTLGGLIGSFLDIRERKQAEEAQKILQERLQRAEKMESLGLLAGGVAHDLNNALGILVGYSELLYDGLDESDPLREDARNIMLGGEQAAAIIQDLLTLARRGVQTKAVINLNKMVTEYTKSPDFLKMISLHPHIRIKTELESALMKVVGSQAHLSKTLINLVSNAAEAMTSGGEVIIRTEKRYLDMPVSGYDEIQEGEYVVLTVSDEGEGIIEDDLKRIFEPFFTKKIMGRSGTGLGLSVVWGTVKDHDGYIDVQSSIHKGTTFTLYFPVADEEIKDDKVTTPDEYMGRGEIILVIDDIKTQRDLVSRILTKLNYQVVAVGSGEEAVEYLRTKEADLIVLDMIMEPGIDGFETYRRISEIKPKQKAIIVSGFAETERVKMAQSLGAGAFVKKPYIRERIGLAVRKELDRK